MAIDYFSWLIDIIDDGSGLIDEHNKLLTSLYETEFYAIIDNDQNRVEDGLLLRDRYNDETGKEVIPSPCSILEMMVALAIRIENDIMYDPEYGDETPEWFWTMIFNLGLMDFTDDYFDDDSVSFILQNFLERKYKSNGEGSLFKVNNAHFYMPDIEIWYQMNYFMDEFLD